MKYNGNYEDVLDIGQKFTGKDVISWRGDLKASIRAPMQELPDIGSIILFNENTEQISHENGCPRHGVRGIGEVKGITGHGGCLLLLKVYDNPEFSYQTTISVKDVQVGLIRWVRLKEVTYLKGYRYRDLDIRHPHPSIAELIIEN